MIIVNDMVYVIIMNDMVWCDYGCILVLDNY